jgi:hypothetical protein
MKRRSRRSSGSAAEELQRRLQARMLMFRARRWNARLASGADLDTGSEKGKMSGCEKGRRASSLMFRIPCQGAGAVERRGLTCCCFGAREENRPRLR